jgi:type VI protein secretion system component VasA
VNLLKHVRPVYFQALADDVTRHSSGTDSDPQLTIPLFKNGVESLREFIRECDVRRTGMSEGILSLSKKVVTCPKPRESDESTEELLWRGLEITLTIDESFFEPDGVFLFGHVLQHAFAFYLPSSAFVQLRFVNPAGTLIQEWPPCAGGS